jgi:O-antigen/teichoic acid export membrane protein
VPKDLLWRLLTVGILLAVFVGGGMRDVPAQVAFAVLIGVLGGLIVASSALLSRWRGVPSLLGMLRKPRFPADDVWRRSRLRLWVVAVSAVVYANLDVVLTALLLGTNYAALYFAANRLALVLNLFETSVNIVTSPMIANELAHGNHEALADLSAKAAFQVFLPTAVTGGLMLALAVPLLRLFGSDFVAAESILVILLSGRLLLSLFGPSETFLIMSDEEDLAMKLSIVGMVAGFGVAVLAGYLWGAVGIAAGTMSGAILRRVLFTGACYSRLGLRTDILFATGRQFGVRAA